MGVKMAPFFAFFHSYLQFRRCKRRELPDSCAGSVPILSVRTAREPAFADLTPLRGTFLIVSRSHLVAVVAKMQIVILA